MQAYATSERLPLGDHFRSHDQTSVRTAATAGDSEGVLIDHILGRLADLVADRLMARNDADNADHDSVWLDARGAAEYLGLHCDTLRKLAAQRAIPTHQDGPRCKLYPVDLSSERDLGVVHAGQPAADEDRWVRPDRADPARAGADPRTA